MHSVNFCVVRCERNARGAGWICGDEKGQVGGRLMRVSGVPFLRHVADLREHHVDPLVARLSDACYIDAGMIRRALAQRSSFNLIHLDTMMKIDVFIQ